MDRPRRSLSPQKRVQPAKGRESEKEKMRFQPQVDKKTTEAMMVAHFRERLSLSSYPSVVLISIHKETF